FDKVGHVVPHGGGIVFQVGVEEGEDGLTQLRRVAVRGEVFDEVELVGHAEGRVLVADAVRDVAVAGGTPEHVFAAGGDQEGARGDERADVGPAPAVVIDPEGAVAMPIGGAVHGHAFDAAALANGCDGFDSFVRSPEEPGHRSAAAESGDAHFLSVDVVAALQVIEGAHGVPHFGAGRGVATAGPVETPFAVGAVMHPL